MAERKINKEQRKKLADILDDKSFRDEEAEETESIKDDKYYKKLQQKKKELNELL